MVDGAGKKGCGMIRIVSGGGSTTSQRGEHECLKD